MNNQLLILATFYFLNNLDGLPPQNLNQSMHGMRSLVLMSLG